MKIGVLGTSGMLGSMLSHFLHDEEFIGIDRDTLELFPRKLGTLGPRLSALFGLDSDYIVNCMGATKPYFGGNDPSVPIYTNAIFPHQLAQWCDLTNTKLIHITTDCVFDGALGDYTEKSVHSATDDYGRSKSMGESKLAMNIRTSIIGPENGRKRHFLEWVKSQEGKTVNGFTNHLWNGITTLELSRSIMDIIDADVWIPGTFHVFSESVSKATLIDKVAQAYGISVGVNEIEASECINRTLDTVEELNDFLNVEDLDIMLEELAQFEKDLAS